jgi:hypothetical protein
MKRVLLCSAALLSIFTLSAQKYSIKKGKISADDVVIARYDGKGGVFKKLTIKINSVDDQPLLHIEEDRYDFKNPILRGGRIYVTFTQPSNPDKKLYYRLKDAMLEKELLNHIFKDGAPSIIKDNKLNEEELVKFVGTTPYDPVADSLSIRKMEEENKARIAKLIPRDKTKPVELKPVGSKDKTGISETFLYDIYQAQLLIGRVEKRVTQGMSTRVDYSVWMKSEPFEFDGVKYNFSPVAYLDDASPTFDNEIIMLKDKSEVKFKTPGNAYQSAEYSFVNWLISSSNL